MITEPDVPTTALTEQTINTGTIMILDDPHFIARQLASYLDILTGSADTLLSTKISLPQVCVLNGFQVYSHHKKQKLTLKCANV